jgi:hypothetical protein
MPVLRVVATERALDHDAIRAAIGTLPKPADREAANRNMAYVISRAAGPLGSLKKKDEKVGDPTTSPASPLSTPLSTRCWPTDIRSRQLRRKRRDMDSLSDNCVRGIEGAVQRGLPHRIGLAVEAIGSPLFRHRLAEACSSMR